MQSLRHFGQALRLRVALAAPTAIAFGYMVGRDVTWSERIVSAAVIGVGIYLAMYVAVGVTHLWLGQAPAFERLDVGEVTKTPVFVAGMVVVSLMWAWWHVDRDRVVRRIASCVEDRMRADEFTIELAVLDCSKAESFDERDGFGEY